MTARTLALATVATVTIATSLAAAGLIWMTATDPASLVTLAQAGDIQAMLGALFERLLALVW